jgi:hypothetical protein
MKSVKVITYLYLVIAVFTGYSMINVDNAYGQGSPVYLGEHCWEGGGGFITMGLTHMGDRHLSFCGLVTETEVPWAINGSFEVVGNSVLITSTESATLSGGTIVFARIADATLDLSTLNGTAHFMEMAWAGGDPFLEYYSFDITYVDCGTGLPSDGVDKRDELIRFLSKYSTTPEENQE